MYTNDERKKLSKSWTVKILDTLYRPCHGKKPGCTRSMGNPRRREKHQSLRRDQSMEIAWAMTEWSTRILLSLLSFTVWWRCFTFKKIICSYCEHTRFLARLSLNRCRSTSMHKALKVTNAPLYTCIATNNRCFLRIIMYTKWYSMEMRRVGIGWSRLPCSHDFYQYQWRHTIPAIPSWLQPTAIQPDSWSTYSCPLSECYVPHSPPADQRNLSLRASLQALRKRKGNIYYAGMTTFIDLVMEAVKYFPRGKDSNMPQVLLSSAPWKKELWIKSNINGAQQKPVAQDDPVFPTQTMASPSARPISRIFMATWKVRTIYGSFSPSSTASAHLLTNDFKL